MNKHYDYFISNLISKYSEEYNLNRSQVYDIIESLSGFIKYGMEIGEKGNLDSYKNIFIKHFGTFIIKNSIIKKYGKNDE